ncbi:MAG: hypothetical protein JW936_05645, partial [Sedimentisphaerales bacterium]|nr:hypothetical protein [Sedimentisphaerales bacterium]
IASDCFSVQNKQTTITGVFLDAYHLLIEGPCSVSPETDGISYHSRDNRTLIGAASHFDAGKIDADLDNALEQRRHWLNTRKIPAQLDDSTRRTLYKALSIMKSQVCSPAGMINCRWTTPDRWPHRNLWLWDSAFHAIGWRNIDPAIARDAIMAVLDVQQDDGFVAHAVNPYSISTITQPPILTLGVKLINDAAPDNAWIEEVYPKLAAHIEWDLVNRDSDGTGLLEWFIEGDPNCRSGESGMDNSPRFDAATQMDAVDFNAFTALSCEIMGQFAKTLQLNDAAEKWRLRHEKLCRLIRERLWSEDMGFFVDYDLQSNCHSSVLASSGFMPLICGAADDAQAAQLAGHLSNSQTFGTAFPVPSVAAGGKVHHSPDMWRGPTWININWLVAYGLDRYGFTDLAMDLRKRTMRVIEHFCEEHASVFEYYDDQNLLAPPQLLRKGKCAPEIGPYHQVFFDYGWTATLYTDLIYSMTPCDT